MLRLSFCSSADSTLKSKLLRWAAGRRAICNRAMQSSGSANGGGAIAAWSGVREPKQWPGHQMVH